MKVKRITSTPLRGDMGFDINGRPLPMSGEAVHSLVMSAIDDPESELVAVIMRRQGDLMLQVMGPPSRETIAQLKQVLETLINGYANILKGQ